MEGTVSNCPVERLICRTQPIDSSWQFVRAILARLIKRHLHSCFEDIPPTQIGDAQLLAPADKILSKSYLRRRQALPARFFTRETENTKAIHPRIPPPGDRQALSNHVRQRPLFSVRDMSKAIELPFSNPPRATRNRRSVNGNVDELVQTGARRDGHVSRRRQELFDQPFRASGNDGSRHAANLTQIPSSWDARHRAAQRLMKAARDGSSSISGSTEMSLRPVNGHSS